MFKNRYILKALIKSVDKGKLSLLYGSRRVGKTMLLKEMKKIFEDREQRVLYLDLKNSKNLMRLNEDYDFISELIGTSYKKKTIIIIDDIDLILEPEHLLKRLITDYQPLAKIIVSYSNSKKIDVALNDEYLSELSVFELKPLNFIEFLDFRDFGNLIEHREWFTNKYDIQSQNLTQLKVFFTEFIKFGSYPEVVLSVNNSEKEDVLSSFINTLLQRDVQAEGIKDISKLYLLLKLLAEKSGELLNSNECAKNLNISITAIENYLKILEKLNIISRIKPFYGRYEKELKKMPMIYINDLGVRNSVLGEYNSIEDRFDKENYFKNVLFKLLSDYRKIDEIKFWRTQSRHEIDFIIDEKNAIVSKFNSRLFKESKYKRFKNLYPEVKLYFAGYKENTEGILSVFDFV